MLKKCCPSGVLRAGQRCATIMYNPVNKQFLGRTVQSWARIIAFYIAFYSVMAGFFTAHLMVYLAISGSSSVPPLLGQFGYFNYPNSKIRLIATPNCATVADGNVRLCPGSEELQARRLEQLWIYVKNADYLPPSCLSWIQQPTASYSSSNNTGCILISIQRVFTWTPEAISPVLNTTHLPVQCSSAELNTTVLSNTVSTVPSAGIPLNLDNGNGRTFPYLGQPDYSVAVFAIIIDGSTSTEGIRGPVHITCSLDVAEQVGLSEAQLAEIHDYPQAAEAVIEYL